MNKNHDIYISIIIPVYNCSVILGKNLPILIDYLNSNNYIYEIVIVEDGSKEELCSDKIAKMYNCIYFKNSRNLGKGASIRNGMLLAKGKYRIFTDADIPYEPCIIQKILLYLDFKEYDIVVGDRTINPIDYYTKTSLLRTYASYLYSFIVGRFIVTGHFDTQCGIKGLKDYIAMDIFDVSKINRFAFDVELIYIALKRNYDIKRIPVKLRSIDGSSVNIVMDSLQMIIDIFRIKFNHILGKYKKN